MKNKSTVAFMADIVPAECECHKGQFFVRIFMSRPNSENPDFIVSVGFETMKDAEKNMPEVIKKVATNALREFGLNPDSASKVVTGNDSEAEKLWREAITENNPNLH